MAGDGKFRMLSLDGGGVWALLQAMALQEMHEDAEGWQILGQFDLATANSGGSIVLAGLMLNWRPSEILRCFDDDGLRTSLFRRKGGLRGWLARWPLFPRYLTEQKLAGLREIMKAAGDYSLAEIGANKDWPRGPAGAPVRCQMVAFDYDRLRAVFLRSYGIPRTNKQPDADVSLAEAVHASSNAPVKFFDAPAWAKQREARFWDGAMGGYNNPAIAALADAVALEVMPRDMRILTMGTGTVVKPPPPRALADRVKSGIGEDIGRAATAILNDPPDAATYLAHVLTGDNPMELGPVVRLSPAVMPAETNGRWEAPAWLGAEGYAALDGMELDAVARADVDRIKELGLAWIAGTCPNQAIRLRSNLTAEPGDATFADAVTRWQGLG